jgi:hypothetical protein
MALIGGRTELGSVDDRHHNGPVGEDVRLDENESVVAAAPRCFCLNCHGFLPIWLLTRFAQIGSAALASASQGRERSNVSVNMTYLELSMIPCQIEKTGDFYEWVR